MPDDRHRHTVIDEHGNPVGGDPGATGFGQSFETFRTVFVERQRASAGPQRALFGLVMMALAFVAGFFLFVFGAVTVLSGLVETVAGAFRGGPPARR
jgi:hypothetical protein